MKNLFFSGLILALFLKIRAQFGIFDGIIDPGIFNTICIFFLVVITGLNFLGLGWHLKLMEYNLPPARIQDPTFLSLYDLEDYYPAW